MSSFEQKYNDAVIYCFSATGNTVRAAELVKLQLEAADCGVELHNIKSGFKPLKKIPELTIIAFPVYAWTLPSIVQRFIKQLPNGEGARAVILATWGGDPAAALTVGAKLLKKRNYQVTHTGGAIFPDNWTHMVNPPDKIKAEEMIAAGEAGIKEFSKDLLMKKEQFYKESKFLPVLPAVSKAFILIGRRALGKTFYADSDCTGCGLCEKTCPVKNIKKSSSKHPVWGFHCEDCCKCINLCPTHAVNASVYRITSAIISLAAVITLFITLFLKFIPDTGFFIKLIAIVIILVLSHVIWLLLMVGVINPFILLLEKKFGKAMNSSFTKKFRRYRFPGFKG